MGAYAIPYRVRRHDTSALFVIESGHLESASISNDFDEGESFEEGWMERKLFFDDIKFDIFRFAFHSISRNCNSSWMFHEEEINLDTRRWRLDLINRSMRDIYERVIIGTKLEDELKVYTSLENNRIVSITKYKNVNREKRENKSCIDHTEHEDAWMAIPWSDIDSLHLFFFDQQA